MESLLVWSSEAPPAFGYLADTAGYRAGWATMALCSAAGMALLWGVRRAISTGN